jgi:UDP-N-acetylmuramate dehydrogenase
MSKASVSVCYIIKTMTITKEANLGHYSTMGLGGTAAYKTEVVSRDEVVKAYQWAKQSKLPVIMIGGGSNIIWGDEGFNGLLIVNKIPGYEIYQEDEANFYITVGAGEPWDSVVERSVAAGLSGIEALSLIPGSAGGTPIQNVGAYGQEIADTLTMVEVFDTQKGDFASIAAADCGFSYRDSRFKSTERGRYLVIGITLHLTKTNPQPPFYPSVQAYFDQKGIAEPKPSDLRAAVVAIRSAKLPDPAVIKNTGSFFGNPIVTKEQFDTLNSQFPNLPNWPLSDGTIKLSAAWMIEQAGFKDIHDPETGMSTWPTQPLVLVNEKARKTADLLAFKEKIVTTVQTKFGIILVQEPELLP